MGDVATIAAAKAKYNKQEGYIYLTGAPNRIVWVNATSARPELNFATDDCTNLFANKAGTSPPKLRLVASGTEHNFVFSASEPECFSDRDGFRDKLKILIRNSMQAKTPAAQTPVPPKVETPAETPIETSTPSKDALITEANVQAGSDQAPTPQPVEQTPALDPVKHRAAQEYRTRSKLLQTNPELISLHKSVVQTGLISEADFWGPRQNLIEETIIASNQKKGKASNLVDPRPASGTSGTMKVTMTPQLAQAIFEDWPVVERAFKENVPSNMKEGEFWKRYFESRLYHNHRASVRSSAAQHVIKEDAIFDKYLEPVDDDLEPRHARSDAVSLAVDLVATREDHIETGNTQDHTMQAGKQRAILPLIRKFNEHSERLLNSAL